LEKHNLIGSLISGSNKLGIFQVKVEHSDFPKLNNLIVNIVCRTFGEDLAENVKFQFWILNEPRYIADEFHCIAKKM